MVLPSPKKAAFEEYWRAYFSRLDELAPHERGTRAAMLTRARSIVCYACKDGALFWFDAGDVLTLAHRSSGLRIETLFRRLADPVGINFKTFPDSNDIGPVNMAEVGPGETVQAPVLFHRIVWFTNRARNIALEDAISCAEQDHAPEGERSLWTVPAAEFHKSLKKH